MLWRSCFLATLAMLPFSFVGCAEEVRGVPHTHNEEFEVTLCGECGSVKEDGHVCKAGAAVCPYCDMHKGSILCCSAAVNGHRDVILCRKCGETLLHENCCKEGIAACPKCGLHKGSPGCCKIERVVDDGSGHAMKPDGTHD